MLMNPVPLIAWCIMIVGPPTVLVYVVRHWWHLSPRIEAPKWRSYAAIGAIALVGLSQSLLLVFGIWLDVTGGRSYQGAFTWLAAVGFLSAPTGFLASLLGKGTLRWPACSLAVLMTILWFGMGSVE